MAISDINNLVSEYGPALYKLCIKLARNKQDAEDLYQETFIKITYNIENLNTYENAKTYILQTAIYIWKSSCRKNLRRMSIAPTIPLDDIEIWDTSKSPEDDIIKNSINEVVSDEVNKLEPKYKILMYLFYTLDMKVEEISKIVKLPSGTVKSRLHKARQIIKKRLEAANYEY